MGINKKNFRVLSALQQTLPTAAEKKQKLCGRHRLVFFFNN